jgi:NAD(P)-dependent dehydrogenase (short-subunit alcohol dehydrogenase family)
MSAPDSTHIPSQRLAGKVAIITGAAAGIGRAAAKLFAAAGAAVVVADIAEQGGASVVEDIKGRGGNALFVRADVADAPSVKSCVARTVEHYGRLDVLYNNAGGSSSDDGRVTEISAEILTRVMAVNLLGTWHFCHYGIPEIVRCGGGSLINTSSALAAGMQAGSRHAYTAAKGGVLSLTRAIALDYAGQRVRANVIVPGFTASERVARDVESHPQLTGRIKEQHPLGYGQPLSVGYLALYLASDESAQTTGQVFAVNNEVIG